VKFDLDVACRVREGGGERGQSAQMRGDADGGEAGGGRLDACYQGEQVVDGVSGPGVGVGAGIARNLWPGAEVERKQLAPGVDGIEVFVGHAGVFEGAGEVEAEIVGGAEDAVGGDVTGIDGENLAEDFLLMVSQLVLNILSKAQNRRGQARFIN